MRIETARVVLRGMEPGDVDGLARLIGDAESMRYVGDGRPLGVDDARRWIEVSQANYADHGYGAFTVIENAGGRFAGYAGLVRSADVRPPDEAELIYGLLPAYRGKGLAGEVAAALVEHGFDAFGLRRILATIDPANTPSLRIVERLGFRLAETKPDENGQPTHYYWKERDR